MVNHVDGDWHQAQGSPTSFSNISLPGHPRQSAEAIRTWLDERISEPGVLEEFARGSKPIQWEENGIRPYTKEEIDANRAYLGAGAALAETKEALEVRLFIVGLSCARVLMLHRLSRKPRILAKTRQVLSS